MYFYGQAKLDTKLVYETPCLWDKGHRISNLKYIYNNISSLKCLGWGDMLHNIAIRHNI
jgi:hypothetical protein